jgi:hypothetical protein
MIMMKILMVLTSHDKLGNTGRKTGFWLEEFAAPYFTFLDAGATITVASPKGGQPPLDPVSDTPEGQTELTRRFKNDPAAQKVLANTVRLSDVEAADSGAVFYPGGHGPMWDLAEDPRSIALIEAFWNAGKPVRLSTGADGPRGRGRGGRPRREGRRRPLQVAPRGPGHRPQPTDLADADDAREPAARLQPPLPAVERAGRESLVAHGDSPGKGARRLGELGAAGAAASPEKSTYPILIVQYPAAFSPVAST